MKVGRSAMKRLRVEADHIVNERNRGAMPYKKATDSAKTGSSRNSRAIRKAPRMPIGPSSIATSKIDPSTSTPTTSADAASRIGPAEGYDSGYQPKNEKGFKIHSARPSATIDWASTCTKKESTPTSCSDRGYRSSRLTTRMTPRSARVVRRPTFIVRLLSLKGEQ